MKKTVLFAAVFIIACLVFFPSCSGGSSGSSISTDDLEGIWVATGEDGGTAKAMLFEFSGNNFTRIGYTEVDASDPDGPDMIQEEGSRGTYSISDDTLIAMVIEDWDDYAWDDDPETKNVPISYEGNTFTISMDGHEIEFTKKSFSRPLALINTWYELPGGSNTLVGDGDGTYTYTDPGNNYTSEGTWTASPDLMRIITTYENDNGTESTFYVENLYEYEISGTNLELSWDDTVFSTYTNVEP
jgi:hypothetical protein